MSAPQNPLDDPRITAYVLGELEGTERAAFEREAASHRELAAEIENVRRTVAELSEAFLDEVRPAPELSVDQRAALAAAVESVLEADAPLVATRPVQREISGPASRRRWAALTPVALALAAVAAVLVHVAPAPLVTSLIANNTLVRSDPSSLSDQDFDEWRDGSQAFRGRSLWERKLSLQDGTVSERLGDDSFRVDGPASVERFSKNAPDDAEHAGVNQENLKETRDRLETMEQDPAPLAPADSSERLDRSWNGSYGDQLFRFLLPPVAKSGDQKLTTDEAAPVVVPQQEMNSSGVSISKDTSPGVKKSEDRQEARSESMGSNAQNRGVEKQLSEPDLNVKKSQRLEAEGVESLAEGESKSSFGLAPLPSIKARRQATCDGKYSDLLDKLTVPADARRFGRFFDYGRWEGTNYADRTGLPPAYWVYVAPDWYLWGENGGKPAAE
jgi:hypothetical protein